MDNKFKSFVIVSIIALAASVVGCTYFLITKMESKPTAGEEEKLDEDEIGLKDISKHDIGEPLLIDIVSKDGTKHFMKLDITFGIDNRDTKKFDEIKTLFEDNTSVIRDSIIKTLRSKIYEDMTGNEAQELLRKEILSNTNFLLNTDVFVGLYFKDFFIQ